LRSWLYNPTLATSCRAQRATAQQNRIGSLAVLMIVISVILFGFCELASAAGTLLKEPPTYAAFSVETARTATHDAQRPQLMRMQCFGLGNDCVSTLVMMLESTIL
jgi:hypothetical protein